MKKILILLSVVITFVGVTYADTWAPPVEKDYCSDNKIFIAHVKPAEKDIKCKLEVFEIKESEKTLLWQCTLGNEVAPVEVFVSDDGRYVVTNNEWYKAGYGNHVVAFYGKDGLIKNYAMEELLPLPKDVSNLELFRLIPYSASSRHWDSKSIKFFDIYNSKLRFCVWLHLFDRWIAWNPATGEEVKVDDKMVKQWNQKGRLWALKEVKKGTDYYWTPYEFLGKLKNLDDRPLIERLLSDEEFRESSRTLQGNHLIRYNAASHKRLLAEQILANWDARPADKRASSRQRLYYLGSLEGVVTLPRTDDPNKATLWIYLIPSTVPKDQWHKQPPVQRLAVSFSDFSFRNYDLEYTHKFPFAISTVTPAEYWVKVVLDKTVPLSKSTNKFYIPQVGNYENKESPVIRIKAGETIENMSIDCTYKVTDGTD